MKKIIVALLLVIFKLLLLPNTALASTENKTINSFPYTETFIIKYGNEYIYKLNVKPGQEITATAVFGQIFSDDNYIKQTSGKFGELNPGISHVGSIDFFVDKNTPMIVNGARAHFTTLGGFNQDKVKSTVFKNVWYWKWEKNIYPSLKISYLTASEQSNKNNLFYLGLDNSTFFEKLPGQQYIIKANMPVTLKVIAKNYFDANIIDACNSNECALEIKPGNYIGYLFPNENGPFIKKGEYRSGDEIDIYKLSVKKGDIINLSVNSDKETQAFVLDNLHCNTSCGSSFGKSHLIKGTASKDGYIYLQVKAKEQPPANISRVKYKLDIERNPNFLTNLKSKISKIDTCSWPSFLRWIFNSQCSDETSFMTAEENQATSQDEDCQEEFNESKQTSISESAELLGGLLATGSNNWYNKFKCKDPQSPTIPQKARDMYKLSSRWDPRTNNDYIQCVAFAYMSFNMSNNPINKVSGSAIKFAGKEYVEGILINNNDYKSQFEFFESGKTKDEPRVGDLMIWKDYAPDGHVGIITNISKAVRRIRVYSSNSVNVYDEFKYNIDNSGNVTINNDRTWRPSYWSRKKN